jgi:uncharacterized protein YaaN involved in tellurite resistance
MKNGSSDKIVKLLDRVYKRIEEMEIIIKELSKEKKELKKVIVCLYEKNEELVHGKRS